MLDELVARKKDGRIHAPKTQNKTKPWYNNSDIIALYYLEHSVL